MAKSKGITQKWIADKYAKKIEKTQDYEKKHGDPVLLIQSANNISPEEEANYIEEFKGFKYVSKKS